MHLVERSDRGPDRSEAVDDASAGRASRIIKREIITELAFVFASLLRGHLAGRENQSSGAFGRDVIGYGGRHFGQRDPQLAQARFMAAHRPCSLICARASVPFAVRAVYPG